jgi:hypothetical protein
MIKMNKRNFRSLVFLLSLAVAAAGLVDGFSSGGLAAGQSELTFTSRIRLQTVGLSQTEFRE